MRKLALRWIILNALLVTCVSAQDSQKLKLNIQAYRTNSVNLTTDMLEDEITAKGGASSDFGLGLKYNFTPNWGIQGGLHFWKKIMKTNYPADLDNQTVQIDDNGKFSYTGLYIQTFAENRYIFGGIGLDIPVSSKYRTSYTIYSSTGDVISEGSGSDSPLDEYFQDQLDIVFLAGFKLTPSPKFTIKPTLQITVPTRPVVDFGVTVDGPVGEEKALINVMLIKFGVVLDINI